MDNLYLDSSAVVKYYVPETGSAWVRELIDAQADEQKWEHEISISQLTMVEVAAAVEKRRRMKGISQLDRVRTLARFGIDYRQRYTIVRVSDSIVEWAVDLTSHHPLRAYDAVQLATALRLNQVLRENRLPPLAFVSADENLCQAAEAEGLTAVNPNELGDESPVDQ
jgi:predicted nucleic acid-binding protein